MNFNLPDIPDDFEITWSNKFIKSCITYWFPKLKGLPVPKTFIIKTDITASEQFRYIDNDNIIEDKIQKLVSDIKNHASRLGYPIFLRTGQTSAKHDWKNTCFVSNEKKIRYHIDRIILFSCVVDIFGLPADIWAVREFLHLDYAFKAFDDMPISKEFRFFIDNGKITHEQFYWPENSIENPSIKNWKKELKIMSVLGSDRNKVFKLVQKIADKFKDDISFSVDICKTINGNWYITDMAPANVSFKYDKGK
jgi:hypothetical protein